MKKSELKALLKKLFIRDTLQENNAGFFKSMSKKDLKDYVNTNGGFTKGKVKELSFDPNTMTGKKIPEGAFGFSAILSDESINLNGYRILLSAWQEGFQKYFDDYEGGVYLQHDMEQPIGKTLDISVNDKSGELVADGYAYDDLTQSRVSRGLVTDVSTGHIPLEIFYINKDTNEQKTPDEFFTMLWDMIDRMYYEKKTWEEIKQAIADIRDLWIETHTKVQIVEYSFVSVGANTQARIKKINNTIEVLNESLPEGVEIVDDKEDGDGSVVEGNGDEIMAENEGQPNPTEEPVVVKDEDQPTENDLKNEGGSPEGSEDIVEPTPEIVEEDQPTIESLQNRIQELEAINKTLEATNSSSVEEIKQLKSELETLKKDKDELEKHNNSKKRVLFHDEPSKESEVDVRILKNSVRKLLNN